jgi:hypothetical protein
VRESLAWLLETMLRRHHWDRDFFIANGRDSWNSLAWPSVEMPGPVSRTVKANKPSLAMALMTTSPASAKVFNVIYANPPDIVHATRGDGDRLWLSLRARAILTGAAT